MSQAGVEQILYLMDEAFEGSREHSLLANLHSIGPRDWLWTPPGGGRSVRDIVAHVGDCKYMYYDYAFGGAVMTWDDSLLAEAWRGHDAETAVPPFLDWLREGHRRLRASFAALDDAELPRPRMTNWGALHETRWIASVMIEHDLYHAGEINHLRALCHGDDRWAWAPTARAEELRARRRPR
jgi:uncharacterized damage-inducible protein DinB